MPTTPTPDISMDHGGTGSPVVDGFSLVQGGPIYRFQVAIHMAMPDRPGVLRRALLLMLAAWLPLLLLSLAQGLAFGTKVQVPFFYDYAVNIRFLVALPLLIVAEAVIDPHVSHAVKYFVRSRLVGAAELPLFEEQLRAVARVRDAFWPTLLLIAAAILPSFWMRKLNVGHLLSSWHATGTATGSGVSLAGWWYVFVSLPIFRLLLFRWLWLIVIWAILLRRLSKLPLRCIASNPDGAGGLGFLTEVQPLFGFVAFAASAAVAGAFANAVAYGGQSVVGLKFQMITFCVLMVVILALPLLAVTPKLIRIKKKGTFDYGTLGTAYASSFQQKWIEGQPPNQELLGSSDIQSLADLRSSFGIVEEMKIVLIDKRVLVGLTIPVILPMLPLLILATPTNELIRSVLKLLV